MICTEREAGAGGLAVARGGFARRRERPAWRGALKTHKNGHSARADDASILPSALDRENGVVHSSVRSPQISRG
jgi:hypothetical protein